MRHFFIFVFVVALAACSSAPKPPTYEGAPRININPEMMGPDRETTITTTVPL